MATDLFQFHERQFESHRFVYPVVSRRSCGISIGINLNPDKICNFDCIYCQVNRRTEAETRFVETAALLDELDRTLHIVTSGQIYDLPKFRSTPVELRRLNDIAFSGDGEPTTYKNFDRIVAACAEVKDLHQLNGTRMVLITNASMFHRPHVQRALDVFDQHQGEVWAKLDAGTEEYYQLVERTTIPFQRILDNITLAARTRPIVIQSLFMRIHGVPPSVGEQETFCHRLSEILDASGEIKLVQIYTVARTPAERFVTPLTHHEIDRLVTLVRDRTGLPVRGFYGPSS